MPCSNVGALSLDCVSCVPLRPTSKNSARASAWPFTSRRLRHSHPDDSSLRTAAPCNPTQVPSTWAEVGFPAHKPLSAWLEELRSRLRFILCWLTEGRPAAFWLPGLLNPQALLVAALHNASGTTHPLEKLSFQCEYGQAPARVHAAMRSAEPSGVGADSVQLLGAQGAGSDSDSITPGQDVGDDGTVLYVHGLFLQGARWDASRGCLAELLPRQLQAPLPIIGMRPVADRTEPSSGVYICPVYKTTSRADFIMPSGHIISNLITSIELPVDSDSELAAGSVRAAEWRDSSARRMSHTRLPHWIGRGVAAFLSS